MTVSYHHAIFYFSHVIFRVGGAMVISLIDAWVRLFKVPRLVVVAVAHQLIRRLDKNALD